MVKEKRFLPVELHEPVEDWGDEDFDFYEHEEDKKHLPKKRSLYIAS